jgi:hypothetical protein
MPVWGRDDGPSLESTAPKVLESVDYCFFLHAGFSLARQPNYLEKFERPWYFYRFSLPQVRIPLYPFLHSTTSTVFAHHRPSCASLKTQSQQRRVTTYKLSTPV